MEAFRLSRRHEPVSRRADPYAGRYSGCVNQSLARDGLFGYGRIPDAYGRRASRKRECRCGRVPAGQEFERADQLASIVQLIIILVIRGKIIASFRSRLGKSDEGLEGCRGLAQADISRGTLGIDGDSVAVDFQSFGARAGKDRALQVRVIGEEPARVEIGRASCRERVSSVV